MLLAETRRVEFKRACPADGASMAQVARASMAMSNRANGGVVVIGVRDEHNRVYFDGIVEPELGTWRVRDHVADRLFKYTDPPLSFELTVIEHGGRNFVVLEIDEFEDVPTVCKRSFQGILVEGAIYVRPRRKPESVAVPTAADMRDLVELAVEKRARRLLAQAERLGLRPGGTVERDVEQYEAEAGDLLR